MVFEGFYGEDRHGNSTQKPPEDHPNQAVGQAADTLAQSGNHEAARELSSKADKIPTGIATTAANAINGNPEAGKKAIESPTAPLSTAMNFAGMASMFARIQNIIPMLGNICSGMGDRVMGALGNSGGLAAMGNTAGNPLAKMFTQMGGVDPSNTKMMSVDPRTGVASTFGTPPFAPPAASQLQQNTLGAVPGMSAPSPTMG